MLLRVLAALFFVCSGSAASLPRMGLVVVECPEEIDPSLLLEVMRDCVTETGRFEPVLLPDSSISLYDNIIPHIQSAASAGALDFLCVLTVRPLEEEPPRAVWRGDSLFESRRTTVTLSARFYTSSGDLMGTAEESSYADLETPLVPDLDGMAAGAAVRLCDGMLLRVFPVEVGFTASEGGLQDIPAGSEDGLRKGMFLSAVASASEIPVTPEGYEQLRSRGLLQVIRCDDGVSRARLLAGRLAPGGPVTAIEQGAPALLRAGWAGFPVELEEGAEQEDFSGSGLVSFVRLGVDSYRWGLCFGGSLMAGTMENLSAVGVEFRAGPRIALAAPSLALRLAAGGMVDFMIQEVAVEYLATDASSVLAGGLAEACLEYLPSSHLGLSASVGSFLGSRADSWTVQEASGQAREAADDELYFSEVALEPFWLSAGIYYLIY